MHILIAPNAFKNSLDSTDAAKAIKLGLEKSKLDCTCSVFPIADGGDGTVELIIKKREGIVLKEKVHDPLGRIISASYGLIDDGQTVIIEMAAASGIRLLKIDELNPLHATSYGTGELIKLALDKGVTSIVIAMGGSATVDGGTGILKALGFDFLDEKGISLNTLPLNLTELHSINTTAVDQRIFNCAVNILCDVDSRLLGKDGAAAVFGPQKGAKPVDVIQLDSCLKKLAKIIFKQTGKNIADVKYGGAAGGAAAGLYGLLNALLVNGAQHFLDLTGFEEAVKINDLVITGEGSLDEQTLHGKGPYAVACAANKHNIPVIAVAGKIPFHAIEQLHKYFDVLLPINNEAYDIDVAIENTKSNLIRTGESIGNMLYLTLNPSPKKSEVRH
jgi:glycerate kinase